MLVTPKRHGRGHYAYGSIKTYLSAVRDYHIERTGADPTDRARVRRVLHAARKYCIRRGRARRKWPISPAMLRAWRRTLTRSYNDQVKWAAALLALFGLHRVSEYASTRGKHIGLKRGNVEFATERDASGVPLYVHIHLERFKGDFWRHGMTLKHFQSGEDLCVVTSLWELLKNDVRPATEPLFRLATPPGRCRPRYLTRTDVAAYTKRMAQLAGLPEDNYNTHSFRAGGAVLLWEANYSISDIQILGRWRSDAFRLYLTQSDARIKDVTGRMARARPGGIVYAQLQERLVVEPLIPSKMQALARVVAGGSAV